MFDDLAAYYHENVVTEFLDYRDTTKDGKAGRSRDLRRALVAATALFHLREHLPIPGRLTRREVEQRCPDYGLLGDVVNSAKHQSISQQTPHGAPLVNRAASIEERKVVVEYGDAEGSYRHAIKVVAAKLTDGSERDLLELMTSVINYWETHLHALGVLSSPKVFAFEEPARYRARDECNGGRMDLEIVRGQRFRQTVQLLRFNQTSGKAEPVDLTGVTVRGAIYKPSYELDLSLFHEATGKVHKTTIALTEAESMDLCVLATEEEKNAFAMSTQSAKAALEELARLAGLEPRTEGS